MNGDMKIDFWWEEQNYGCEQVCFITAEFQGKQWRNCMSVSARHLSQSMREHVQKTLLQSLKHHLINGEPSPLPADPKPKRKWWMLLCAS